LQGRLPEAAHGNQEETARQQPGRVEIEPVHAGLTGAPLPSGKDTSKPVIRILEKEHSPWKI
jgi:hypothetical protein